MTDRPKGELVIQTIAMPKDTNPNGDIFGGWVTSQMDLGSGILAAKTAQARVVTAAMEGMSFLERVKLRYPSVRCVLHTGFDKVRAPSGSNIHLLRKPCPNEVLRELIAKVGIA